MYTTIRRLVTIGACLSCMAGLASAAAADSSLSATTLGAYAPTNAAVLYGTVSTGGSATNWTFEWGTTTAYGQYTQLQNIPAGATTPQNVYAVITGLKPGTTYHYQLIAANYAQYNLGAYGGDRTFTTPRIGNVQLQNTSFKANKGVISIPIKCASAQNCKGKLTITRTKKLHRKRRTLTCASKAFSGKAGSSQKVQIRLARACTAGLKRGSKLNGRLLAVLSSGQPKLTKNIVIRF